MTLRITLAGGFGNGNFGNDASIESALLALRARFPDAAPLHRLGRWTSGVVLSAASGAARAGLCDGALDPEPIALP